MGLIVFALNSHAFVSYAGDVATFTPSVLANVITTPITLSGSGLNSASLFGSVRALRFEQSAVCSPGAATNNTVVAVSIVSLSTDDMEEVLTVPLPNGGLSAGLWSICIDWRAYVSTNYVRVGASAAFVKVGELTACLLATFSFAFSMLSR